jgi:hypothetical protein
MDVSYDQIGAGLVPEAGSFLSVSSLEDFIPRIAQGDLKGLTNALVIIYYEDPPLRPLHYLEVRRRHTLRSSRHVEPDIARDGRYVGVVAFDHAEPLAVVHGRIATMIIGPEACPALRLVGRGLARVCSHGPNDLL